LRTQVKKKKKRKKMKVKKNMIKKICTIYQEVQQVHQEKKTLQERKERKGKPRIKRVCYNCGKNGHMIVQCPYERKEEDNDKKKKFDKCYKKDKKYTKKKPYGQAHIGQEWNLSDECSESESDDMTTIAIKGKTSSSKSLFPKLSKHICLMAKEGKI
jgi:hypothetical protein